MTTIAIITAAPDLEIVNGQITTTSNQVAAHFGKRHDMVLRAVRNLECSDEFRLRNFAESSYINEQGKEQPCYRLTRDGFVFLAMGFTGKEAAQWKEAYITAFNKMEQELLACTTRPSNPAIDYDRISPAQAQDLKELVHSIVDAGIQGFAETWARLHKKFRVNSYLELPATRFEEARDYLLGKLPEEAPQPQPTAFSQGLNAARENALHYFDAARAGQANAPLKDIPAQVLEGIVAESLMQHQFLAGFDYRTGQMQVRLVPRGSTMFDFQEGDFAQAVSAIPTKRLPDLQDALNRRIARHLGVLAH